MAKKVIVPKITRRTGIPASTIYNILRGVRRPSWSKAESLAAVTNQEPGFFMALREALDSEVIRIMQSHMGYGHSIRGEIKDVQCFIGGKLLKGKLMRFRWGFHKPRKWDAVSDEEVYIYKKGEKFFSLKFITNYDSHQKAKRYFKIIVDSIR